MDAFFGSDMCNRYNIKSDLATLVAELFAKAPVSFDVPEEVFPGKPAPGMLFNSDGRRELHPMRFGLIPAGKTATTKPPFFNNARIESRDKWPWNRAFVKQRCVIPMTSFREPAYWGEDAGAELQFFSSDHSLLLAAGIHTTYEVGPGCLSYSMSLLMRPAFPYVFENGHHRSPFFLRADGVDAWLDQANEPVGTLHGFAHAPDLNHSIARQMSPSWKKRQQANLTKRDAQELAMKTDGPLGLGSGSV
ncbi:MAG: SOS response-associated peptidase family protein [Planctomycetota bacterium]